MANRTGTNAVAAAHHAEKSRRTTFMELHKAVIVHPLPVNLCKNLYLAVPTSIRLPKDKFITLEGMYFEHPSNTNLIGKKI